MHKAHQDSFLVTFVEKNSQNFYMRGVGPPSQPIQSIKMSLQPLGGLLTNPKKEKINLIFSSPPCRETATQSESATHSHQKNWPIRPTLLHGLVEKKGIDWKIQFWLHTLSFLEPFSISEVKNRPLPKLLVKKRPLDNVLLDHHILLSLNSPLHTDLNYILQSHPYRFNLWLQT